MKVFILEDDPERIRWFREYFFNDEVTFIESCKQADQFKPPYDLILLDHDLGGRQLEDHEDSGTTFATLIKDKLEDCPFIIIHSYNAVGAGRMRAVLGRGYYAPFHGDMFHDLLAVIDTRG